MDEEIREEQLDDEDVEAHLRDKFGSEEADDVEAHSRVKLGYAESDDDDERNVIKK